MTHRLVLLLDPAGPPAWTAPKPGLAAQLYPPLAAWISRLLPNPATVRFRAGRLDTAGEEPAAELELTADILKLDPLAWLRVAATPIEFAARVAAARAEWRARNPRPAGAAVHRPYTRRRRSA